MEGPSKGQDANQVTQPETDLQSLNFFNLMELGPSWVQDDDQKIQPLWLDLIDISYIDI